MDGGTTDGDDLALELTRWLAEQRADAAAASRARERWLRQAAQEDALVAGVLLDLAERSSPVVIHGAGDRTHRGMVRAVGEDVVALRCGRTDVLLRYGTINSIRSEGHPLEAADRAATLDISFAEAVSALSGDRPRVLIVTRDGTGLAGDLRSVGRDVAVIRTAERSGVVYVPLESVAEVSVVL